MRKIIALLVTKGEKDLNKTLESIESQTRKPDAIIIASENPIKVKYKTFLNPFSQGLSSNTQQSLLKIYIENIDYQGEIVIATIDDDDAWRESWLMEIEHAFEKGYNFVSGWINVVDGKGNEIEIRKPIDYPSEDYYIYGNDGLQGSNKAFSLNLALESGGMHKEIKASTDRILNTNLLLHPEVKYKCIRKIICDYTFDKSIATITNDKNRVNELKSFYNSYSNLIDVNRVPEINQRHYKLHGFKDVIKWK